MAPLNEIFGNKIKKAGKKLVGAAAGNAVVLGSQVSKKPVQFGQKGKSQPLENETQKSSIPNKKRKIDENDSKSDSSTSKSDPQEKQEHKVFLSNITKTLPNPKIILTNFFNQHNINFINIDPAYNGRKFRGFAVATLKNEENLKNLLKLDKKPVIEDNDRPIYISKYKLDDTKQANQGNAENGIPNVPRVFNYALNKEKNKVYVSNLKTAASKLDVNLVNLFSKAGKIKNLRVPTNKEGNERKPYCYVEFETDDEAKTAVEKFDHYEFFYNKIRVQISDPPKRVLDGMGGMSKKQSSKKSQKAISKVKVQVSDGKEKKVEKIMEKKTARPVVMFLPRSLK